MSHSAILSMHSRASIRVQVQERKLHESGLDRLLDRIYISDVIGAQKPDPAFFTHVLNDLGNIPKERFLIVGDSLTGDILGGIRSGLPTCLYNPSGNPVRPDIRPDREIRDLLQVISLVLGT